MEEIFQRLGPWHIPVLTMNIIRGMPFAHFVLSLGFMAPTKHQDYWCSVSDGLFHDTEIFRDNFNRSGAVWHNKTSAWVPLTIDGSASRCEYINSTTGNIVSCSSWDFDTTTYKRTILQDFGGICDQQWMLAATQSLLMFGVMIGNFVFSHISDWFGRKTSSILSASVIVIGMCIMPLSRTLFEFNIFRFITSLGHGGIQNVPYTLTAESVSAKYRAHITVQQELGWIFGVITLPCFTYFFSDWIHLQIALTSVPVAVLLLCFTLDESPKWLMASGKYERAEELMKRIVRRNHIYTQHNISTIIKETEEKIRLEEREKKKTSIIDLFKNWHFAAIITCSYFEFAIGILVYYNFMYFMVDLGSNPNLNLLYIGIMEFPVIFVGFVALKYLRRRLLYFVVFLPSAIACIIILLIPQEQTTLRMVVAMVGKTGVQLCFGVLSVHVTECFPTMVRAIALGSSVTASRIGAMISPFCKELGTATGLWWFPQTLDAGLCMVAIMASFLMPETFKLELPDTFQETLDLAKKRKRQPSSKESALLTRQ